VVIGLIQRSLHKSLVKKELQGDVKSLAIRRDTIALPYTPWLHQQPSDVRNLAALGA
jgi:hypothetical protein